MAIETDDRGRVYLPKELRERHGEQFRLVDLPTRILLVPVADDPLEAVREEIGDAFEDESIADLKADARESIRAGVDAEIRDRDERQDDEV